MPESPLDFSQPVPEDPHESPTAGRRLRLSRIVLGVCGFAILLVAFGIWNPGQLVAVHTYLSRPCELVFFLIPALGFVYFLRRDGDQEGIAAFRVVLGLSGGVLLVLVCLLRAPGPATVAVSPDGRFEAVLWLDSDGRNGDLVIRSREGLLSREATAPLSCVPRGSEVHFVDGHTVTGTAMDHPATFDPDTLEPTAPADWCSR
ncbi:hypothetical protein Lfu02_46590 [Longispora fulva]|uniref:Transmembrane protein n=1 Tax=Longispora fulva TaxID=619741 RepID=A0A8J7KKF3_9ACTN|nr:hypothetical protein [Longispora fulva]MBG6138034.1 hypothetical protein [Longispora fulva]GIG60287.1 hypothetical protein Lfu02_46590 [Longispora fulva]